MTDNQNTPVNESQGNVSTLGSRRRRAVNKGERNPFSNPQIILTFTLQTQEAIRLYARHFNPASQSLFNIMINTTRLERQGVHGVAAKAKKAIDVAIDTPLKEINLGILTLEEMLKTAGEIAPVNYTHPREFTTAARTPEATKLIRLFTNYDQFIALLDGAYLNALAPAEDVADQKTRIATHIQNLSKTINTHAQNSVDQLQKLVGEKEVADSDEKTSEADEANHNESQADTVQSEDADDDTGIKKARAQA